MDAGAFNNPKSGPDSQDAGEIQPAAGPSGTEKGVIKFVTKNERLSKNVPLTSKGVEKAKKRLRAFSIQKKSSLSPVSVPKPITTGHTTVFIGKATGVKTVSKPEPDPADPKKPPKPPKPGGKQPQDSYVLTQKRTLAEIEDMKRKMELIELGIPLGLICPAPNSDKAMPTKAMPPIKTFLDLEKVDDLIREAKKARAEGKEFKFDYRKLLPDYDNPFQRKKDGQESTPEPSKSFDHDRKSRDRDKRRSDKKYNFKRQPYKNDDRDRYREGKYKEKSKERDQNSRDREKSETFTKSKDRDSKYKESDSKSKEKHGKPKELDDKLKEHDEKSKIKKNEVKTDSGKDEKEAEVNLKDFVVCDSWSDNEEKSKDSTPKPEKRSNTSKILKEKTPVLYHMEADPAIEDPMAQLRQSLKQKTTDSPKPKLEKLNPVIDSFSYEINEDDDEILGMFEENSSTKKFVKLVPKKEPDELSIDMQVFDYDAKDDTFEGMADDTFLESVINEIKQEEIDETSQDKGLVEYDESPSKDSRDSEIRGSVTPEIDDERRRLQSSRSDYSDGYKSTESGYKSTDSKISAYKSDTELERIVEEKKRELERMVDDRKISKYTEYSMETWSFVLKICQPLLFRHDRNKCYKETLIAPKLWYTENPKLCNCVKDRGVVYSELEMCKMEFVDSLYRAKQQPEPVPLTSRAWYPRARTWMRADVRGACSDWETEDSQTNHPPANADMSLDKEYRRFMQAVWPEVSEAKSETPRSSPVRREATKKKADERPDGGKQSAKKMKLSSEGWSQESEIEEEVDKSVAKKVKPEKEKRKRKHSTSSSLTESSESEAKKKKKNHKKKGIKKSKSKDSKRRRVSKKNVKKLKEKQKKKKKKVTEIEEESDVQDLEREKKRKEKRLKKKKLQKQKKKNQKKKKAKVESSSSSDSSSNSESDEKRSKKKKKNSDKKNKRKESSESREELFDVNILNNIKTEKETDDEISKKLEFSPRRQKPREIINVKELQSDFVGNSIQIKKEVEEDERRKEEQSASAEMVEKQREDSQESHTESVTTQKETKSVFKEEEESQSTPQMRPEEANNSQCSSQESVYSLKNETPAYEKDVSHLRPSSQNSNYSFHDVMSSGMYSKNKQMAEQDKHSQSSLEIHHQNSLEQQMQRQKLDTRVQDHEKNSRELDMLSYEQEIYTHEQEMQNKHDMRGHEQNIHGHEQDFRSHDQDIHSHEQDVHSHDQDIHSHAQDIHTHDRDIHSHDQDIHTHDRDIHSHDQDIHSHELDMRSHDMQVHDYGMQGHDHDMDTQEYEQGNYEMYEQMAMAYQSNVASQHISPPDEGGSRRIETVVRGRTCGEIKCDWRAGDGGAPPHAPARPSRWGLKPGEVNIVLTGGEQEPMPSVAEPVYKIQSLANRSDTSATGYDEAYANMFGASDKLQYGDCFSTERPPEPRTITPATSSLDARINLALKTTVLGEVAKDTDETEDKDGPDKGILVTKSLNVENRAAKRVSFADGYKPGQDSDVEEPPVKKKKKWRRLGCAWPCPAQHPDHVPLWDALPPPPPPPGSPPPTLAAPPPTHLLRQARVTMQGLLPTPPHHAHKFDPNSMSAFMPPEPPPGMISFQNL